MGDFDIQNNHIIVLDERSTHVTPCLAHLTKATELNTTQRLSDVGSVHNNKMASLRHVGHRVAVVLALVDGIDVESDVAVQQSDLDGGVGISRQRGSIEDGTVEDQDAITAGTVGRFDGGDGPDLLILVGRGVGGNEDVGVGTPASVNVIGHDEAADRTMVAGEAQIIEVKLTV